jgi:hypothetical protein
MQGTQMHGQPPGGVVTIGGGLVSGPGGGRVGGKVTGGVPQVSQTTQSSVRGLAK